MPAGISIRAAKAADATHLACFIDIAGEGLPAHLWSEMAEAGEAPFEIGRGRALRPEGGFSFRNAVIAEIGGEVVGGMVGYPLDDPYDLSVLDEVPDFIKPLVRLESQAAGSWYVNVLATYAEHRGKGVGSRLLDVAEEIGRRARSKGMAIIVASHNAAAMRLYLAKSYAEKARETVREVPGVTTGGDWVLLVKSHS